MNPPSKLRDISTESKEDDALLRRGHIDYLTPMRLKRKNQETLALLPHIQPTLG